MSDILQSQAQLILELQQKFSQFDESLAELKQQNHQWGNGNLGRDLGNVNTLSGLIDFLTNVEKGYYSDNINKLKNIDQIPGDLKIGIPTRVSSFIQEAVNDSALLRNTPFLNFNNQKRELNLSHLGTLKSRFVTKFPNKPKNE